MSRSGTTTTMSRTTTISMTITMNLSKTMAMNTTMSKNTNLVPAIAEPDTTRSSKGLSRIAVSEAFLFPPISLLFSFLVSTLACLVSLLLHTLHNPGQNNSTEFMLSDDDDRSYCKKVLYM